MRLHGNARLTPHGRTLMCQRVRDQGWTARQAADAAGCSERTCYWWLARYDAGEALTDRSSAPGSVPGRTSRRLEALIEALRCRRWTSTRIAALLDMATSTVCAVLARLGLNRLSKLEPPEPPNRYCRERPGELIHVDIKKLGRFHKPGHRATGTRTGNRNQGAGWDHVHVAVDDNSRLAYVEVLGDERGETCVGFLRRAIAWFAAQAITVERVMTDNGTGYRSHLRVSYTEACRLEALRAETEGGPAVRSGGGRSEAWLSRLRVAIGKCIDAASPCPAAASTLGDARRG